MYKEGLAARLVIYKGGDNKEPILIVGNQFQVPCE
jgi:hypothetical protein